MANETITVRGVAGEKPSDAVSRLVADAAAAKERQRAASQPARSAPENGSSSATERVPDTVAFCLSDGRTVEIGPPPKGIPIHRIVYCAVPENLAIQNAAMLIGVYRALMYVREVGARTINPPLTQLDFDQLMIFLGDQAVDEIIFAYNERWSPAGLKEKLETIKKNPV